MRRFFPPLVLLFAAVSLLASCLKSDNETISYSDDVAITAFSIASAEMIVHTTSSTGKDSTYITSNKSLSSYKFVIDQTTGEIYNVDSLPNSINAAKMLVNCATKKNGVPMIRSIEKPDSSTYVSSSDTIDLSQPRTICVYSASGKYSRDYTVKVNVHKQDGNEMVWHKTAAATELASLTNMKGFQMGDALYVLGVSDGNTMVFSSDPSEGSVWTLVATLNANASLNAVVHEGCLYVLDGSDLKVSADGINYNIVAESVPIARLVAQSSVALYGISGDGKMMSSEDNGQTWIYDEVDFGTKIPSRDIDFCTVNYPSVPNTECVVITGNRDLREYPADSTAVVLTKIVEKTPGAKDNKWSGVSYDSWDDYLLPRLDNLTIFGYNKALYALGGAGIGACKDSAFEGIGKSIDYGYSWELSSDVVLPDGFESSAASFTAFSDNKGYLWIICGGTGVVWKGQLNRVGWAD